MPSRTPLGAFRLKQIRIWALRCTIDSSCVIALDHLDLVPQLTFLFSVVLVPAGPVPSVVQTITLLKRSTRFICIAAWSWNSTALGNR